MKPQKTTQIGLLDKIKNQLQNVKKKSPERSVNKSVVYKSKNQLNSSNGNFPDNSYYNTKKDKMSLNQESFYQKNSTEKKNRSIIEYSKSPEVAHEKNTLTTEITSELNRAVFQLKSYVNQDFDNNFFKEVIQDITNLINILNNIALEAANITSELNEKIFKLEGEKDKLTLQNKELHYQIQEFRNKHKLSVLSDISPQLFVSTDLFAVREENLRLSQENKKLIEIAKTSKNKLNYSSNEEPTMERSKLIKKNVENQINNNTKDFVGHYTFNNKINNDSNNLGCNLSLTNNNNKGFYGGANQAFNFGPNTNSVGSQNNRHFFYSLNNEAAIAKQRKFSIEKSVIFDESQGEVINGKNQSSNEETKRKFKYIRPRK